MGILDIFRTSAPAPVVYDSPEMELLTERLAELVDVGQARGEIARPKDGPTFMSRELVTGPDKLPPATLSDLGISRQRLHEARKLEPLTEAQSTKACWSPSTGCFQKQPNRRGGRAQMTSTDLTTRYLKGGIGELRTDLQRPDARAHTARHHRGLLAYATPRARLGGTAVKLPDPILRRSDVAARIGRGGAVRPDPWGDMPLGDRPVAQPPRRMRSEWRVVLCEAAALLLAVGTMWLVAWGLAVVMM